MLCDYVKKKKKCRLIYHYQIFLDSEYISISASKILCSQTMIKKLCLIFSFHRCELNNLSIKTLLS